MDCPICENVQLVMSERHGIEIDYCPTCRGVWLDRGELDKIIERATSVGASPAPAPAAERRPTEDARRHPDSGQQGYRKRKRGGFLSDLFDFD